MRTTDAGPYNRHFCARHARIAFERMKESPSRAIGHVLHVRYRLQQEIIGHRRALEEAEEALEETNQTMRLLRTGRRAYPVFDEVVETMERQIERDKQILGQRWRRRRR